MGGTRQRSPCPQILHGEASEGLHGGDERKGSHRGGTAQMRLTAERCGPNTSHDS